MRQRLPSDEELVDLSWLLDSALLVGDRDRAIDSGTRLLESLQRHQEGLAATRPGGGATTVALQDASQELTADLGSVLSRLNTGASLPPVEFRHRIQAFADGSRTQVSTSAS
jgi:hypothetical protein